MNIGKRFSPDTKRFRSELDTAIEEYHDLDEKASALDPEELATARLALRDDMEDDAVKRIQNAYGQKYDYDLLKQARKETADILHEESMPEEAKSIRKRLQKKEQTIVQKQLRHTRKKQEQEL